MREYEAFGAASTALAEGESDLVAGGLGFNVLSAFFFGGNAASALIELTTPVRRDGSSAPALAPRPRPRPPLPPPPSPPAAASRTQPATPGTQPATPGTKPATPCTQARLEVGGPAVPIGSKRLGFALPAKYTGGAAPAPTDGNPNPNPNPSPNLTPYPYPNREPEAQP